MSATGSATNWRSAGACRSADPDLFFPLSSVGPAERQIVRAKMICAECGVRQECLDFALSHDQVYGIWGGTTRDDRQRERRRRRRAAARRRVAA
jgi:WhiB family redox-sensing transcriptional regulator